MKAGPWGAVYVPPGAALSGSSGSACPASGAIAVQDGESQGAEEPLRKCTNSVNFTYQVNDVLKDVETSPTKVAPLGKEVTARELALR